MEDTKTNSGQNLGIAALITGIITFLLAVIPCIGVIAIIPGIIAIVLASVGLSQASRSDSPKGVIIAGLVVGIVAVMISLSQIFVTGRLVSKADKWPSDFRNVFEEIRTDVLKDLEKGDISIKIESGDEKIEIKANANKKDDLVKKLEELETGKDVQNDTLRKNN